MTTFGDFTLVRAVSSYGGAEVVRARRCRGGVQGPPVHLALYGAAPVQERLIATAEAAAHGPHERIARIFEVGRCQGSLYAVADALDGLDLRTLLEHERSRRAAPDVGLALAVALGLAQIAQDLMERDVWAGARGAGLSSLFASGLRLDAVVLGESGVALRPLAGAADDPARPTPFRAPELGAAAAPSSGVADVFAITQVLRALCAGDPDARSGPRLGPTTAGVAPLLAAGLAASVDERVPLASLIDQLRDLLEAVSGEARPVAVVRRALAGTLRPLLPPTTPEPLVPNEPRDEERRAMTVVWPDTADEEARTHRSLPVWAGAPPSSDHEAVARVFTEEGEPPPTAVRLEIGPVGAFADEPTQKLPARPSGSSPRRSASDPPWISGSDVEVVEETGTRPAAAPVAVPSELEGGPTVEMRSPFDDGKTEP